MSIYSNDNIRKIAKLTTHELPHLVQKRENNGLYSKQEPKADGVQIAGTNNTVYLYDHLYLS